MNKHTARRKRRRAKQAIAHGVKAVRKHARPGGRTGAVFAKQTHAKDASCTTAWPNPPGPTGMNLP